MAVERFLGAIEVMFRMKMQHGPCDFGPLNTLLVCIKQAQTSDKVFLVVSGQDVTVRRISAKFGSSGFCTDVLAIAGAAQFQGSRNTAATTSRQALIADHQRRA